MQSRNTVRVRNKLMTSPSWPFDSRDHDRRSGEPRRADKGREAVSARKNGGHATLCPPYKVTTRLQRSSRNDERSISEP